MESKTYTPCGGCGATEPDQRCIGCMHPFTEIKPEELPVTPEWELINRIVSQWGNAVEMPNMEQWLKDYASKAQQGARWVKASERLPGIKKPVKWRSSGVEMKVQQLWYMVHDTNSEYLSECEWYDESAAGRESDAVDEKRILEIQKSMGTLSFADKVRVWAEKVGYEWRNFAYWKEGKQYPLEEIYNKASIEIRAAEMLPKVSQTVKEAEDFLKELKQKVKQQKEK